MTEAAGAATAPAAAHARARHFVILLGWVSLFADLCYEGMRGALGGYLALLGASATAVGAVAGTGEAIGYGLRYVSGALDDRTQRYWALTFAGRTNDRRAAARSPAAGRWSPRWSAPRSGWARRCARGQVDPDLVRGGRLGASRAFAINGRWTDRRASRTAVVAETWRGAANVSGAWAFCALAPGAIRWVCCCALWLYPDPRARTAGPGDPGAGRWGRATGCTWSASRCRGRTGRLAAARYPSRPSTC
jgi:hypothetical protein